MTIRGIRNKLAELRYTYGYVPRYVLLHAETFLSIFHQAEDMNRRSPGYEKVKAVGFGPGVPLVVIIDGVTFRVIE